MYMRGGVVVNAERVKWKDRVFNLDRTIALFSHSKKKRFYGTRYFVLIEERKLVKTVTSRVKSL